MKLTVHEVLDILPYAIAIGTGVWGWLCKRASKQDRLPVRVRAFFKSQSIAVPEVQKKAAELIAKADGVAHLDAAGRRAFVLGELDKWVAKQLPAGVELPASIPNAVLEYVFQTGKGKAK